MRTRLATSNSAGDRRPGGIHSSGSDVPPRWNVLMAESQTLIEHARREVILLFLETCKRVGVDLKDVRILVIIDECTRDTFLHVDRSCFI